MGAGMRSMTGYGRGSARDEATGTAVEAEVAVVNRKNFDVQVAAPREWTGFDQVCDQWLRERFARGRAHVRVRAEREGEAGLRWDEEAVRQSLDRLKAFALAEGVPFEADGHLLLELAKSAAPADEASDWRAMETAVRQAVDEAAAAADAMRAREGEALARDLRERLDALEGTRRSLAEHAEDAPAAARDALFERLRRLGLDLDASDERVLKELAIHADRADISEESTRLASHLEQFREFLDASEPVGRRMDFLCQEIHRELNTIGSKAGRVAVTQGVIDGKNRLEQLREQVQNVE